MSMPTGHLKTQEKEADTFKMYMKKNVASYLFQSLIRIPEVDRISLSAAFMRPGLLVLHFPSLLILIVVIEAKV